MSGGIKAVFFDFGGVISRLDREGLRQTESRYGIPQNGLLAALYGIPEWREVEIGRLPEEEWIAAANRKLREVSGRELPDMREISAEIWRGLDEDVVQLAKVLRGPYQVGLISNSTKRLEKELLEQNGVHSLFEVIVNSARVGIAKPDTRIYLHAAEQFGVAAAACVHIDDLAENVEGARKAGFQAVHYRGDFPELESALRSLGVQW